MSSKTYTDEGCCGLHLNIEFFGVKTNALGMTYGRLLSDLGKTVARVESKRVVMLTPLTGQIRHIQRIRVTGQTTSRVFQWINGARRRLKHKSTITM